MKVEILSYDFDWISVRIGALRTIGLNSKEAPSNLWRRKILLSEHSPIRKLIINWVWKDLPYWVSTHMVRHSIGITHFVRTQRSDRTGIDRNELSQGALVEHECVANVQALINISRKRLCYQASKETREAWEMLVGEIQKIDKDIAWALVPECLYRGGCTEYKSCGWSSFDEFYDLFEKIRNYE